MNMAGIQETTEVLAFVEELGQAIVKAKSDGKLDWADMQHMLPLAMKAKDAAKGLAGLSEEIKDLNGEELEILSKALANAIASIAEAIVA